MVLITYLCFAEGREGTSGSIRCIRNTNSDGARPPLRAFMFIPMQRGKAHAREIRALFLWHRFDYGSNFVPPLSLYLSLSCTPRPPRPRRSPHPHPRPPLEKYERGEREEWGKSEEKNDDDRIYYHFFRLRLTNSFSSLSFFSPPS